MQYVQKSTKSKTQKAYKKAYALLIVVFLLVIFSLLSVRVVENISLSNNINKLKYFNIQANIHMAKIAKYINTHSKQEILQLDTTTFLNDNRFELIIKQSTTQQNIIFVKVVYKDFANMNIVIVREFIK